jgi:sortase A
MRTRIVEVVFLAIGVALLAVWGGARIQSTVSSRAAVRRFEAEQVRSLEVAPVTMNDPASGSLVDFSLWSEKRVGAYKQSLVDKADRPLALLRIPRIHLEVPVYNDTDDLTLNRGVGRILGTAQIGTRGNVGIAGHRDGFFRGLKDIAPGDEIDLVRVGQSESYVVENIHIVKPEDVSVLEATPVPSLTLVTCFPFYYIGSAPQRFIVRASIASLDQSHQKENQSKSSVAQIYTKEKQK